LEIEKKGGQQKPLFFYCLITPLWKKTLFRKFYFWFWKVDFEICRISGNQNLQSCHPYGV